MDNVYTKYTRVLSSCADNSVGFSSLRVCTHSVGSKTIGALKMRYI